MDEAVWVIIGVISILVAMGVLTQFAHFKSEDDKIQAVQTSLDSLQTMCQRMCAMPKDTYLKTTATIPSGTLLWSQETSICTQYEEETNCRICPCELDQRTILNLTSEEAKQFFRTTKYNCFYLRSNKLEITCQG